jgi:hypothetical protein
MMLQIDHRESRDIDIFLSDPQLLPFLDPQKHDFEFEVQPPDYEGDGSSFLKFAFKDIGEIDFILGHAMTLSPTTQVTIEGETTLLETIPEIIAKKISGVQHQATRYLRYRRGKRAARGFRRRSAAILSKRSRGYPRDNRQTQS